MQASAKGQAVGGWKIRVTIRNGEGEISAFWIVAISDQGEAVELLRDQGHAANDARVEIVERVSAEELNNRGIPIGEAKRTD